LALLPAVAALALAGCGGGNLGRVTGQVVENGQPRALGPGGEYPDRFRPRPTTPTRPLALGVFVRRDGTFVADMNDGTGAGLRPGKYKLKLNRESTSIKTNAKLFKESYTLEAAPGTPVRLTIDLGRGDDQSVTVNHWFGPAEPVRLSQRRDHLGRADPGRRPRSGSSPRETKLTRRGPTA